MNNASLNTLSADNIETLKNSNYNVSDVLREFSNNPLYKDQIVNNKSNVFSLIIYLEKNLEMEKARIDLNSLNISRKEFLNIKKANDAQRNILISDIRNVINKIEDNNEYYLGGVELIANDVINFVKKDIVTFSFLVTLIIILVLFFIFKEIKFVIICLFSSLYAVFVIFGIISFLQIEVTAVSSNFASLVFILSVSMNIHIINYYRLLNKEKNSKFKSPFLKCFGLVFIQL